MPAQHFENDPAHTQCLTVDERTCRACGAPLSAEQITEIVDGRGPRCPICLCCFQVCDECERLRAEDVFAADERFALHLSACAEADRDACHDNLVMPRQLGMP